MRVKAEIRMKSNNRRRRIEAAIDAVITLVVIIIIVIAVCIAGYVLGTIAHERTAEAMEIPTEKASALRANIITPAVTELPESLSTVPTGEEAIDGEKAALPERSEPDYIFAQKEIYALARMLYGEASNCSVEEQAGTIWCVLNRVDDPRFPDTVIGVVTQPDQFVGYKESHPVLPEFVKVAEDVLMRWSAERSGVEDVGRVLPRDFLYFSGDGERNSFTREYAGGDTWDWSARSPYREIP